MATIGGDFAPSTGHATTCEYMWSLWDRKPEAVSPAAEVHRNLADLYAFRAQGERDRRVADGSATTLEWIANLLTPRV